MSYNLPCPLLFLINLQHFKVLIRKVIVLFIKKSKENNMKKRLFLIAFLSLLLLGGVQATTSEAGSDQYKEGGFSYRVSRKEAIITKVDMGSTELRGKTEITVPASIGGFPVTALDNYCFSYNTKLMKISLPNTIRRIGSATFRGCESLLTISLPQQVTKIPRSAFSGCTRLGSVQMGSKITKIEKYAFNNCISLKKISLPSSLTEIGDSAFSKCYKLSGLKLGKKLKTIGDSAFYKNYAMKSVTIPAKVKEAGDYAFEKCTDLVKVKFNGKKTKLGKYIFSRCSSLKSIAFPKKIKEIPEYAFSNCNSLTKMKIPKNVGLIKKAAFTRCKKLKSIQLNRKLYALGDRVFAQSGLSKINLNSRLQFIGNGAFQGTKVKNLTLKGKVTYIGNRVFADCNKLKSIFIPASVKGINPGAFNNCVSLSAIKVASGNANYASENGVLYNKGKTRLLQYPLHKTSKTFRTPSSVVTIRKNAFSENRYLQNVTVSAQKIELCAFYHMSALRSVTLLNRVKIIDNSAFLENYKLSKLVLPDSVEKIGSYAFESAKIASVHIPSRLRSLGTGAFRDCNSLKEFTGTGSPSYTVKDGVLYNKKMTTLIQYPAKKKASTFTVPDTIVTVSSRAINNQSYLTKLIFGKKLISLNSSAINNAKKLKSIVFETKKLDYYSKYGVSDCDNLAVIVGPNDYCLRQLASRAKATMITL